MEHEQVNGHVSKLPINAIPQTIRATPAVAATQDEVEEILKALYAAVEAGTYIPASPTTENPALSDNYIFNLKDEQQILLDLTFENFVTKILDVGKGSKRRISMGYPQEYLYVFKYPCQLQPRDQNEVERKNVLIYIKLNYRTVPNQMMFIVSFHENHP